jgi:UTP--glucose-1-phosphate uridylyltransferase
MMPVAGKPMVQRVMDMLGQGGADRFIVVAHPDDHALIQQFRQTPWATCVRFVYQAERLGMAHALECAIPAICEDGISEFILASCDNLYPEGHVGALVSQRREHGLDAVLTLMQVRPEQIPTLAVVALGEDGRVTRLVEKPRAEDAPSDLGVPALYALSTRVLDYLPLVPVSPRGERDFPDALRLLIDDGGAVKGAMVAWRMTMTRPADLLALNRYFLRRDLSSATLEIEVPDGVEIVPPVRIESGVELSAGCCVGPEVYLEAGARVGASATLRGCAVLRGAAIAAGAVVEGQILG